LTSTDLVVSLVAHELPIGKLLNKIDEIYNMKYELDNKITQFGSKCNYKFLKGRAP